MGQRGLRERLEGRLARRMLALSPRVLRGLTRGPIVVEGLALDPQMQMLLALSRLTGQRSYDTLTPAQARREADRQARAVYATFPVTNVRRLTIPGPTRALAARLYVPERPCGDLLVYLHGGGHVIGGFGTHEITARFVAAHANLPTLLVDYRLAPEHRFPAAVDDAVATFRWARAHASQLHASADRVIIGGDSAGANVAAVVANQLRGVDGPLAQWLLYPAADLRGGQPSRRTFADGFFLTAAQIAWYQAHYLGDADPTDPRASPFLEPGVSGVAPAVVVTAGFDPLRDEGEAYAEKLRASGVPTTLRRCDGLIHGFVNLIGVSSSARAALALATDDLVATIAHGTAPRPNAPPLVLLGAPPVNDAQRLAPS